MLTAIDKTEIMRQLVAQLERDLLSAQEAAEGARDAAINEESKSEDKHDTRSIEAGYLAGAQRKRVAEIKEQINYFKIIKPERFSKNDPISSTALVRVELDGKELTYLVVPMGGGLKTEIDGTLIQTVTPQTPLGEALLGMKVGDSVVVESKNTTREYEILAIA